MLQKLHHKAARFVLPDLYPVQLLGIGPGHPWSMPPTPRSVVMGWQFASGRLRPWPRLVGSVNGLAGV